MSLWINHVKAMAKKLGCSYKEAMSDPRTKATYKGAGLHMTNKSHMVNSARRRGGKIDYMGLAKMAIPHIMPHARKLVSRHLKPRHPQLARMVGGTKHPKLTVKHLRMLAKQAGHKLSRNGKPLKKAELMTLLRGGRMSGGGTKSGKISHRKKFSKWMGAITDATSKGLDVVSKGIGIYKEAKRPY